MVVEFKFPPVMDKIKAHVRQHKSAYLIGSYVVIAGITFRIMRGRNADFVRKSDIAAPPVFVRPLFLFLLKEEL